MPKEKIEFIASLILLIIMGGITVLFGLDEGWLAKTTWICYTLDVALFVWTLMHYYFMKHENVKTYRIL